MISEQQARAMLTACETKLDRRLERLRDQLESSDNTLAALWELIVLHAALQIGDGIDHEPRDACPDVLFRMTGVEPFALDATHIGWPDREERDLRLKFIEWVRTELEQHHRIDPTSVDIRLDPTDRQQNAKILAPSHGWNLVFKTTGWKAIADAARRTPPQHVTVDLEPPFHARLRVNFTGLASRGVRSGMAYPQTIRRVSDHPVYAALRGKADQARKTWQLEEPLVVCIGSSLATSLFPMSENHPSAEAAVRAALTNTSQWSMAQQHNVLRDTSGKDYRVRGADRISAVILVSIESPVQLAWPPPKYERVAKARFCLNEAARFPLSSAQRDALLRIRFDHVAYGPQWETWPAPSASRWKDPSRIMNRREPGKTVSYSPRSDGTFDLEIAAEDLVMLLAGQGAQTEVLEAIEGLRVGGQLRMHPRIASISLVRGDAKVREPDRIKLTFDHAAPPLLQGVKVPKRSKMDRRSATQRGPGTTPTAEGSGTSE